MQKAQSFAQSQFLSVCVQKVQSELPAVEILGQNQPAAKTNDTDSKTQRHKPNSNLTKPKIYDIDPDSLNLDYLRPVKFRHQT